MARKAEFEAKAKALTPRGEPYRYFDREFPPGEWVPVTAEERVALRFKDTLTLRERKETDGPKNRKTGESVSGRGTEPGR